MSITRTRIEQLHDDRLSELDLDRRRVRRSLRDWLTEDGAVGRRWPRALGVGWIFVLVAAVAVEPAPSDTEASDPLWASLVFLGLLSALAVAGGALARRRRLGLVASVVAGGLALFSTVMCPVSDHHETVGAWWYLQMTGFTALIGASLAGLRRARAS